MNSAKLIYITILAEIELKRFDYYQDILAVVRKNKTKLKVVFKTNEFKLYILNLR